MPNTKFIPYIYVQSIGRKRLITTVTQSVEFIPHRILFFITYPYFLVYKHIVLVNPIGVESAFTG